MNSNWPIKKLGEVVTLINGRAFKTSEWKNSGIPIIRIQNLNDPNATFNYFQGDYSMGNYTKKDDLLFSWSGSIGTSFGAHIWNGPDGLLNQHIFKVDIDNSEINKSYLYFFLNKIIKDIEKKAHGGAGLVHITKSELEKMPILLPILAEQKKIVERLDAIRKAQELCDQQIQKTEELLESLIYREIQNYNSKITTLGEICNFEGGTQPPKSTFGYKPKEDYIRLLQIRDYKSDKNAVYIPIKERHKTCVETDIMIGRYGPPVFQILKGKEGAYNVALMKCVPNSVLLTNEWLYYFLRSKPVQDRIISLSMRARQSGVRPSDLNELKIPLPNLTEQQRIVEKLEAVQNYKKLLQKEKTLLKELFNSVLDKSMKGELDS